MYTSAHMYAVSAHVHGIPDAGTLDALVAVKTSHARVSGVSQSVSARQACVSMCQHVSACKTAASGGTRQQGRLCLVDVPAQRHNAGLDLIGWELDFGKRLVRHARQRLCRPLGAPVKGRHIRQTHKTDT